MVDVIDICMGSWWFSRYGGWWRRVEMLSHWWTYDAGKYIENRMQLITPCFAKVIIQFFFYVL